ncbi:protoporphyrinogen oxidase HemJ [Aurantimonas sp. A2-1-M11]|uniref:protoporphyrinogen oxidase HemJ n=1 Tax=Aurantimonas sp. A2-1-M11 TaxID=3113712 RepID=UPI002F925602
MKNAIIALAITVAVIAATFWLVPPEAILWMKSLHILAVIAWMAGMLYLPRLFVYHAGTEIGTAQSETFKVMERRLLKAIVNPAMMVTWVAGIWLAVEGGWFEGGNGWLHAKIALVVLMSGAHGYFSASVRRFANDANTKSTRHWRIMNEVPTALMIVIVVLVVVKPF